MTAVRVKSLWLLLIVAKVGGLIVDPIGQELAENPVARLVEVIPVARAMDGLGSALRKVDRVSTKPARCASVAARIPWHISGFGNGRNVWCYDQAPVACHRISSHFSGFHGRKTEYEMHAEECDRVYQRTGINKLQDIARGTDTLRLRRLSSSAMSGSHRLIICDRVEANEWLATGRPATALPAPGRLTQHSLAPLSRLERKSE
jgi:hypothetical protein